ncbi:MAG: response regulator, partial [Acidobacteriota bacterium]|nr:response regulator [Acidobacteriota bacterium]
MLERTMEVELATIDAARELQILVVDDSPVSRKLVEHALEDGPYSLLFARSGREAMDLFARYRPSIVISDWMMPDLCGLDICQRLRADAHRGYTYIILLTSIAEKDNVVKGLAAGADDYLTKPFDPNELLARIGVGRRIIDLHQQIDSKNKLLEQMAHTDPLTG